MDKSCNNQEWEPTYEGAEECKVEMSDTFVTTHSGSRSEYGVMVQQPEYPYEGNGAIFWIDPQHIYFRYAWGLWFPVSNDDPENCETICKRKNGTLYLCSLSSIKHFPVKIYHIDHLPEELFGIAKEESTDHAEATEEESSREPEAAEEDEGPSVPAFVKECVRCRNGNYIAESDSDQFPSAFYELNGHFLCVTFFDQEGDWLADEESFADEKWPSWFGVTSAVVSPLAAAVALREKIQPLIPQDVPFHSIVVANPKCTIVNEGEFSSRWKASRVIFTQKDPGAESSLASTEKILDGFDGNSRPVLWKYAPAIRDALEEFPLKNSILEND